VSRNTPGQDLEKTVARRLAQFVSSLSPSDLPEDVRQRARLLILDSLGIAWAAATEPWAKELLDAISELEPGGLAVMGSAARAGATGAAFLDGLLVHGLDFDDTAQGAIAHTSATALPAALVAASRRGRSGDDFLLAYVVAVEVTARVGQAAGGRLHGAGFHPTSIAGTFGAALAAGKLEGLDTDGLTRAQGIAGSQAAGLLQFLDDGSTVKRAHAGFAASAGLRSAALAAAGLSGPPAVYEGRYGLFATHLPSEPVDEASITADLGEHWAVSSVAVKPFPTCHFTHAFIDAALWLREHEGVDPEQIVAIEAKIHPTPGAMVCEPWEAKVRPTTDYDARFSLPFAVAVALVRGRLGLAELEPSARSDPVVVDLASRVRVGPDPKSAFPDYFSGELLLTLSDGRVVHRREQLNRGSDRRPLSETEIRAKFRGNVALAVERRGLRPTVGERLETLVDTLEQRQALELAEGFALGERDRLPVSEPAVPACVASPEASSAASSPPPSDDPPAKRTRSMRS
jgi:2-methylcitrate dehydratase PrpD